jgi:hypothetical protein
MARIPDTGYRMGVHTTRCSGVGAVSDPKTTIFTWGVPKSLI